MLNRVKKSLVESYVGAIALGWIFAQAILHFAFIFAAPVTDWIARRQIRRYTGLPATPNGLSLQDALPELIKSFCLLAVGYVLLRWLYFPSVENERSTKSADDLS